MKKFHANKANHQAAQSTSDLDLVRELLNASLECVFLLRKADTARIAQGAVYAANAADVARADPTLPSDEVSARAIEGLDREQGEFFRRHGISQSVFEDSARAVDHLMTVADRAMKWLAANDNKPT